LIDILLDFKSYVWGLSFAVPFDECAGRDEKMAVLKIKNVSMWTY